MAGPHLPRTRRQRAGTPGGTMSPCRHRRLRRSKSLELLPYLGSSSCHWQQGGKGPAVCALILILEARVCRLSALHGVSLSFVYSSNLLYSTLLIYSTNLLIYSTLLHSTLLYYSTNLLIYFAWCIASICFSFDLPFHLVQ